MTPHGGPPSSTDLSALPREPTARHEALLEILGQHLIWLRNCSIQAAEKVIETPSAAEGMGRVHWERFAGVASMTPEQRKASLSFAEATTDRFIQLLLTSLGGTGVEHKLGKSHAFNIKLDLEILDVSSRCVIETHTLSRGGEKFFADYWGHWLFRYGGTCERGAHERGNA